MEYLYFILCAAISDLTNQGETMEGTVKLNEDIISMSQKLEHTEVQDWLRCIVPNAMVESRMLGRMTDMLTYVC